MNITKGSCVSKHGRRPPTISSKIQRKKNSEPKYFINLE